MSEWWAGDVPPRMTQELDMSTRLELGDECPRCDGRGEVYDEVFEYEWAKCPYFDFDRRIGCLDGVIATEAEIRERYR